jgi:hypothetical protein
MTGDPFLQLNYNLSKSEWWGSVPNREARGRLEGVEERKSEGSARLMLAPCPSVTLTPSLSFARDYISPGRPPTGSAPGIRIFYYLEAAMAKHLLAMMVFSCVASECLCLFFKLHRHNSMRLRLGPALVLRGGCTFDQAGHSDPSSGLAQLNKKYAPFYRPPVRTTLKSSVSLAVGMVTLLPLRLLLLSGLVMTCWASCIVLRFCARMKNGVIVSSTRRSMLRWIIKKISSLALFICGIQVEESGMPENTEAPKIVVCNHVSYIDVIWALSKFAPSFVAKGAVSRSKSLHDESFHDFHAASNSHPSNQSLLEPIFP